MSELSLKGDRPWSEYTRNIRNKFNKIHGKDIFASSHNAFCQRSLWMKTLRIGRRIFRDMPSRIHDDANGLHLDVRLLASAGQGGVQECTITHVLMYASIHMYVFYSVVVLVRVYL